MSYKHITKNSTTALEELDIKKHDWLLLAKDSLQSLDPKISNKWPDYLLMKFQKWDSYKQFLHGHGGTRLYYPKNHLPTIIHANPKIGLFPPEQCKKFQIPKLEFLADTAYHVTRAWVGKNLIINELQNYNPFYAELITPQIF